MNNHDSMKQLMETVSVNQDRLINEVSWTDLFSAERADATNQEKFNELSREEQIGLMNIKHSEDHPQAGEFKYDDRNRANMEKWHQQNIDNDTWPDPTKAEWGLTDYWNAAKAGYKAMTDYEPEPFEPEPDNWEAVPDSFNATQTKYNSVPSKVNKSKMDWDFGGKDYSELSDAEKAEIGRSWDR